MINERKYEECKNLVDAVLSSKAKQSKKTGRQNTRSAKKTGKSNLKRKAGGKTVKERKPIGSKKDQSFKKCQEILRSMSGKKVKKEVPRKKRTRSVASKRTMRLRDKLANMPRKPLLKNITLTEDNFAYSHICNRAVDDLPSISVKDIVRLKENKIETIQQLVGTYLMTGDQTNYVNWITQQAKISEEYAIKLSNLLSQWSDYNVNVGKNSRVEEIVQRRV
ncbi:hypothetical protein ACOME3_007588 [Neoechinorhynchus agilis]